MAAPQAWPGYQPAWSGWQQPAGWPTIHQGGSLFNPAAWPLGQVPWGYTSPPTVPPAIEPPGNFHPPVSQRPALSLEGRISPWLYALGLAVGLPAIAALILCMIGVTAGITAPWLVVEASSVLAAGGLIALAIAQGRQRRADGWHDFAGPSPWLVLGALLGSITALELPLGVALRSVDVDLESVPATLLVVLLYLVTYVGLVHFLVVRSGALTWRDMARPKRLAPSSDDWAGPEPHAAWTRQRASAVASWRSRVPGGWVGDILVPLAMVLPLMIAANITAQAMLLVLGLSVSDLGSGTPAPVDPLGWALLFVAIAALVPLGEEIFFRGYATNAWGRSLGRNSTILRASLFFAFVHIMNTASTDASISWRVAIFNFGARVPVAFALTWLYMRRRSILASGTLHAGYNGLITLISILAAT
jgi:membrane protease YdiL (CAAX protease family)